MAAWPDGRARSADCGMPRTSWAQALHLKLPMKNSFWMAAARRDGRAQSAHSETPRISSIIWALHLKLPMKNSFWKAARPELHRSAQRVRYKNASPLDDRIERLTMILGSRGGLFYIGINHSHGADGGFVVYYFRDYSPHADGRRNHLLINAGFAGLGN